jgi:hypothetical protein
VDDRRDREVAGAVDASEVGTAGVDRAGSRRILVAVTRV